MSSRGEILENKKIEWGKQSGSESAFSVEKSAFN